MAEVDLDDDTIRRWVIHHYRFDAARHERCNVVVAAYDNESEFQTEFERRAQMIRDEILAGTRSSRENLSGITLEPGHRASTARGHSIRRAIEHGVSPERLLSIGALPHNMAALASTTDYTTPQVGND